MVLRVELQLIYPDADPSHLIIYVCVCLVQRAAQQLKAQRQLEEAFELRLQRMQSTTQTSPQTSVQAASSLSSDTALSTDTHVSSGEQSSLSRSSVSSSLFCVGEMRDCTGVMNKVMGKNNVFSSKPRKLKYIIHFLIKLG